MWSRSRGPSGCAGPRVSGCALQMHVRPLAAARVCVRVLVCACACGVCARGNVSARACAHVRACVRVITCARVRVCSCACAWRRYSTRLLNQIIILFFTIGKLQCKLYAYIRAAVASYESHCRSKNYDNACAGKHWCIYGFRSEDSKTNDIVSKTCAEMCPPISASSFHALMYPNR